jgi:hypothetical protein
MKQEVAMGMLSRVACIAAIAVVLSACGNFNDSRYLPTSPDVQGALELSVDKTTIPADGFSTATLTARISANASPANRTIKFTTTIGTFVGAAGDGKAIDSVVASDGTTSVQLRSDRTVSTATITATVKGNDTLTKQQTVTFDAAAAADILRVSTTSAAVPADGATVTPITVEVAAGLPAGRRKVTFTASLGTFVADPAAPVQGDSARRTIDVDADGSNRAVAYLRSVKTEIGQAIITVKVDTTPAVSASTSIQFERAFATQVLVTTSAPTVSANFTSAGITVTVRLRRDVGTPTVGAIVRFKAVDSLGADRSFFTSITQSDANGEVTAVFTPGTGAALGQLVITATVDGTSVSGTAKVVVVM